MKGFKKIVLLSGKTIEPMEGQSLIQDKSGKNFELWQDEPLRLINRWTDEQVIIIVMK